MADPPVASSETGAADTSFGVAAPQVTLPKGGGAIRSIGEKFAANPVTGAGGMTVPIATSPGRSGFGPELSLTYDSSAGNGPYGIGSNVPVRAVTRQTDKGVPSYEDSIESDVFILSGTEDLVPVLDRTTAAPAPTERTVGTQTYWIQRYRPRVEGLFARIERWTNKETGSIHWRSISKDNVTTLYGTRGDSRIADPADPMRVFSWLACETYDDTGNVMLFDYVPEDSAGVDRTLAHEQNRTEEQRSANRYLKRIRYGNTPSRLAEPDVDALTWHFEVVFDYGEHDDDAPTPTGVRPWRIRKDPFSTYRSGFEIRTYRLCRRVLMFHRFKELGAEPQLVRSTDFTYHDVPDPLGDHGRDGLIGSFIAAVTQSGYQPVGAGYLKRSLPPLELFYSQAILDEEVREPVDDSLANVPAGVDGGAYQWLDLDGEGLTGVLTRQAGGWFYKRNLGGGRLGALELVGTRPSLGGGQFLDLAGDGQLDLVQFDQSTGGFYERTEDGWDTFRPFAAQATVSSGPGIRFADLTGDGHADLLVATSDGFAWYPSLGEEGFGSAETVILPTDDEQGPRPLLVDERQAVFLADLSGDGLPDAVRITWSGVCYWPNLGGRFGSKVTMDVVEPFDSPEGFDPRRIRIADIDGSGPSDIIYLGREAISLHYNQSGNSLSGARRITSFPPVDDLSSVQAVDLRGTGTACLVWSSSLPGAEGRSLRYIDLMREGKPHLLVRSRNNFGTDTVIDYLPSTTFYVADRAAGKPWLSRLPVPVHCVVRKTVIDKWRQSSFATTYSYHHGYFDGVEREHGFGRVEQVDAESFDKFATANAASPYVTDDKTLYQPPVKTVTWYHTGLFLDHHDARSQFQDEFFPTSFRESELPEFELDAGMTPDERREGVRACRGFALRREVHELDVDALAEGRQRPVKLASVACHNGRLQRLQPQGSNRHAVFLVTESESMSYLYELDLRDETARPDPRIAHTLDLEVDELGHVLQSVDVVYPRTGRFDDATLAPADVDRIREAQGELHVAYTESRYADADVDDPDAYRTRLPCEYRTYELTGIGPGTAGRSFTLDDLRAYRLSEHYQPRPGSPGLTDVTEIGYHESPNRTAPEKRLVEHVRTLYFDDASVTGRPANSLPFGTHGPRGLTYETYKLALTDELLDAVFKPKDSAGTVDDLLARRLDINVSVRQSLRDRSLSGYVRGVDLDPALAGQYWMPSGIAGFATDAATHFYLPQRYTDPLGNVTTARFDTDYRLFLKSSTDAAGNTVTVEAFDFRVLAPLEVKDINDNLAATVYDAFGMSVASAIKGDGQEGDNLDGLDGALLDPPPDELAGFFTGPHDASKARRFLRDASTRYLYYFGEESKPGGGVQYAKHPPSTAAIIREIHAADLPPGEKSPIQQSFEYVDGTGAALVKKIPAEPAQGSAALRWIATGRTVLNNKGQPVKQFQPDFSTTEHRFEQPADTGATSVLSYDAAGRLVRTDLPNGAFSRSEYGPWQVADFDANDTVHETGHRWYLEKSAATASQEEQRAARLAYRHRGTPAVTCLDSLGRAVVKIAHNRYRDSPDQLIDEKHVTFTKLDTEGKPLWIRDARGNLVAQFVFPPMADSQRTDVKAGFTPTYDVAGNLLFQHTMDAGDRWMLMDATGRQMCAWDSNEARDSSGAVTVEDRVFSTRYDQLHRPTEHRLSIDGGPAQVIERFEYGESIAPSSAARDRNLRGRIWRHHDQSGLHTNARYDIKGNPEERTRRLAAGYRLPVVDWSPGSASASLEPETFVTSSEFDALNRVVRHYDWRPTTSTRVAVFELRYGARGLPAGQDLVVGATRTATGYTEGAKSTRTAAVRDISYDAKGQQETLRNETGTLTRYEYEADTFRLSQLRTTRAGYDPKFPKEPSSFKDARILQNLFYTYDAVGNVTEIYDDAYEPAFFSNQAVEPRSQYTYDAVYRLVGATGRESGSAPVPPGQLEAPPGAATFPNPDPAVLRTYRQRYRYDAAGNITRIRHIAPGGSWTQSQEHAAFSNRLVRSWHGTDVARATKYHHDLHGSLLNLANVNARNRIRWDYRDMIQSLHLGGGGRAYYSYDSTKRRTRKVIERPSGATHWERIDLEGLELYRGYRAGKLVEQIETHHVVHDGRRVLQVDDVVATDSPRLPTGALYRYQHTDHVGSVALELDDHGQVISYEESHPYGTPAVRAAASAVEAPPKRYRYAGMERDQESGLGYHHARFLCPWLGRWASCDPDGLDGGMNAYSYGALSPLGNTDTTGRAAAVTLGSGLYGSKDFFGVAGYIKEHALPGKQVFWINAQEFGLGIAKNLHSRTYANMEARLTQADISDVKTRAPYDPVTGKMGDNARTARLREAFKLGVKSDLTKSFLENKQNYELAIKTKGGLTAAVKEAIDSTLKSDYATAIQSEKIGRETVAGKPLGRILADRLHPEPAPVAAKPQAAQVITFTKPQAPVAKAAPPPTPASAPPLAPPAEPSPAGFTASASGGRLQSLRTGLGGALIAGGAVMSVGETAESAKTPDTAKTIGLATTTTAQVTGAILWLSGKAAGEAGAAAVTLGGRIATVGSLPGLFVAALWPASPGEGTMDATLKASFNPEEDPYTRSAAVRACVPR